MTNLELYLAVANLREDPPDRPLEEYLRALYSLATKLRRLDQVSPELFLDQIRRAFTADPAPYSPTWSDTFRDDSSELAGFECFESTILSQIVDLNELAEHGLLDNDFRYFGIASPRGRDWYNFDPLTYLECAVGGSIGGWELGDSTDRDSLPSRPTIIDETGNIMFVERPDFEITKLSWEQFGEFLEMGRLFE